MGYRFIFRFFSSFLASMPVSYAIRHFGRVLKRLPDTGSIPVQTIVWAIATWLAAVVAVAVSARVSRRQLAQGWHHIAMMSAVPLFPCSLLSFRYDQSGDFVASLWIQALGLSLAVIVGLETAIEANCSTPEVDER